MSRSSQPAMQQHSNANAQRSRLPLSFFLLVFALSIPLWLISEFVPVQLLPGLPVSSLMAICPVIAASILVYKEDKTNSITKLLKRSFDYSRVEKKAWYIPAILLLPGIMVIMYGVMRLLQMPLPKPQFSIPTALVMFLVFFVAALGEEIGWMGYAIDPLQDRWNALQASIVLGVVTATWHIIPFLQVGRSPVWIAWQGFSLVTFRVLHVWLYNNTGRSVFVAALFHTMVNVSWQLFPNNGSHYDPRIAGLIAACVAVIVTIVYGPQQLTRSNDT